MLLPTAYYLHTVFSGNRLAKGAIASDIDELSWGQYTQTRSLTLTLNLNLETAKMSNIGIKAETLQASAGQSNFSASQ